MNVQAGRGQGHCPPSKEAGAAEGTGRAGEGPASHSYPYQHSLRGSPLLAKPLLSPWCVPLSSTPSSLCVLWGDRGHGLCEVGRHSKGAEKAETEGEDPTRALGDMQGRWGATVRRMSKDKVAPPADNETPQVPVNLPGARQCPG